MLSFMLFVSGLMELYSGRNYDHRQETNKASLALAAILKDSNKTQPDKNAAMKTSGLIPAITRAFFQIFTMLCAAIFAFKATFFLMLPIWLLGFASAHLPWKDHKALFFLDSCFCAMLYFAAAWVVA